jgi:glycosyltransferase involved in cell wall biosynthesis
MAARRNLSIALVTETYAPEVNGVAMTLGRLANGIAERGHRVRLVRPRQKSERSGLAPGGELLTAGLPIPGYPELRFGLPAAGRLRRLWRDAPPDIVHVATEGPLGFSALSAAHRLGIPVLSTFHTNFHAYSRHYRLGWLEDGIARYLRWFHNRTAATLVPTRLLAAELGARGFANVSVLARGVDMNLFAPCRRDPSLRKSWQAGDATLVALVVGRLAAEKNLRLAQEAFAAIRRRCPDSRLVFVGDGPLRRALERERPDCVFAGARYGDDLAAHYASADLFLFPSLTETYGNVVAEALASGLPVVAFDHAAAAELIPGNDSSRLVPAGDAAAFVAAAVALAERIRSGGAARDDAVAARASVRHLDWARVVDAYETRLQEIADRPDETVPHIYLLPD